MDDILCHREGLNVKNVRCSELAILTEEIGQMTSVNLPQLETKVKGNGRDKHKERAIWRSMCHTPRGKILGAFS